MSRTRMPALFLGHGSPMNVLEDNRYTRAWAQLGETLPRPKAIVVVSAHWFTRGTGVTAMEAPKTIHDFGGFPQALYDTHYPAPGSPALAQRLVELLSPVPVTLDTEAWGFDHGSWGVLIKMYPQADIPMVQLSIDSTKPPAWHLEMGRKLASLRDEGIMLVASGNVVHNLRTARWHGENTPYPWAESFNNYVKANLQWQGLDEQHPLVNYLAHEGGSLSNPTAEHFLPLLYVLGTWDGVEAMTIPVDGIENAGTGLVHVGQEHGVGQFFLARQQGQGLGGVGDAARGQNARQQARLLLLGGQRHLIFFLAPRLPIHRFHGAVFQLLGALLGNGRSQLLQGGAVQRLQVPGPVGRHNSPSPVRPSLASIPCSAAISLETSMATSESRLSYRLL